MLPLILDKIAGTTKVVTDMGSTKGKHCRSFKKSSWQRHDMLLFIQWQELNIQVLLPLLENSLTIKHAIICDKELSDNDALEKIESMLDMLNMHKVYMNSVDHDVHVAYISHISHITSFRWH